MLVLVSVALGISIAIIVVFIVMVSYWIDGLEEEEVLLTQSEQAQLLTDYENALEKASDAVQDDESLTRVDVVSWQGHSYWIESGRLVHAREDEDGEAEYDNPEYVDVLTLSDDEMATMVQIVDLLNEEREK